MKKTKEPKTLSLMEQSYTLTDFVGHVEQTNEITHEMCLENFAKLSDISGGFKGKSAFNVVTNEEVVMSLDQAEVFYLLQNPLHCVMDPTTGSFIHAIARGGLTEDLMDKICQIDTERLSNYTDHVMVTFDPDVYDVMRRDAIDKKCVLGAHFQIIFANSDVIKGLPKEAIEKMHGGTFYNEETHEDLHLVSKDEWYGRNENGAGIHSIIEFYDECLHREGQTVHYVFLVDDEILADKLEK